MCKDHGMLCDFAANEFDYLCVCYLALYLEGPVS